MALQERLYTAAEFWDLAEDLADDTVFELINGEICEVNPPSIRNALIAARVVVLIGTYLQQHPIGFVMGADGGFTLSAENVRIPDASFISKSRMPSDFDHHHQFAPDLAVEVISASETPRKVNDKTALYLDSGTAMVWNIYPDDEVVEVWQQGKGGALEMRKFAGDDVIEGGDVMPEFAVKVSDIFDLGL
jgi:Uma2 family endonuclease